MRISRFFQPLELWLKKRPAIGTFVQLQGLTPALLAVFALCAFAPQAALAGQPPTLSLPTATAIGQTGATLGATIDSDGGAAITSRGTVWDTAAAPTGNALAEGGTAVGAFSHARTGLSQGTKYYYQGYAVNSKGTAYSGDGSFYTEPGQASSVSFSSVSQTGMTISWTAGASSDGAIVVVRAGNSAVDDPTDGTLHTASATYGSAALGSSYVVYRSSGTSVAVSGLTPGTTYYVEVFAYKGTVADSGVDQGINYRQTSPAAANQATVAAIWINPMSAATPMATYYLGDTMGSWNVNFEIGQATWDYAQVGIGTNTTGAGYNWGVANWYEDGTAPNKRVRRDLSGYQYTAVGSHYVICQARANSTDSYTSKSGNGWSNSVAYPPSDLSSAYFTCSALNNPGSQTATAASSSQINLSWAKDAQSHDVMIVRSTDASFTDPTQGTTYNVNDTIGGDTVIYRGGLTSFNDTGLSASTPYYYKFYSENWSYYSAGVTATATTDAPADPEISVRGTNMAEVADADYTVAVADGTDFQSQTAGTTHDHIFTITNAGTGLLTLSGQPSLSGDAVFTLQANVADLTLAVGQDETFTIRFAPTDAGVSYTGMVTITSDDSDEGTYTFAIEGSSPCFTDVTGMYVNPTNTTDFTINWTAITGADGYLVDVSTNGTFGGAGGGSSVNTNLIAFDFVAYLGSEVQGTSTYAAAEMQSPAYITRGAGIAPAANGGRFCANGWDNAADAAAGLAANNYFEWTIQPSGGYSMSITNIAFNLQRSNTGASNVVLRASHDSYTADLITSLNFAGNNATVSIAGALDGVGGLQDVSGAITFRLIAWTGASTGTMGFEGTGDDLLIQGIISSEGGSGPDYVAGYSNRWDAASPLSVTGLTAETTYYYRITATNESCSAESSVTGTVTTVAVPSSDTAGPTISNFGVTNKTGTIVLDRDWSSFPIFVDIADSTSGIDWATAPTWALTNPAGAQAVAANAFVTTGHSTGEQSTTATDTVSGVTFSAGTWKVGVWAQDKVGYGTSANFTFTAADDDTNAPALGGSSDDWGVYWNHPDQTFNSECSGEYDVRDQLIARVDLLGNGHTGTLSTYTWSGQGTTHGFVDPLLVAISNALNRGAAVRLIIDDGVNTAETFSGNSIDTLEANNGLVVSQEADATRIMHDKLGLFDYGAGNRWVLCMSGNFTMAAGFGQWNIATDIRSDDLYAAYNSEAEELLAGRFAGNAAKSHAHDGSTFTMQGSWGANWVRFAPYPESATGGDNALTDITNAIAQADSKIYFAINQMTRRAISDELIAACDRGVIVHGAIAEDAYTGTDWLTEYTYLTNTVNYAGTNVVHFNSVYEDYCDLTVDTGTAADLIHAKWMIIDPFGAEPMVIHGSANWTATALEYTDGNDENVQFLRHAGIAAKFFEEWTEMTGLFTDQVQAVDSGLGMKVYAGTALASIIGGASTTTVWEIGNANLLTNDLFLHFSVYDYPDGINRGVNSASTNMHVTVENLCTDNVTNFALSLSSTVTTNSSSTSVWKFVNFDATILDAMAGTNAVYISVPDADSDRAGDATWFSNQLVGYIYVAPSCPEAPTGLYVNPTNGLDFTANWTASTYADGYVIDVSTNSGFTGSGSGTLKFQGFEGTGSDTWTFTTNSGTITAITTTSRTDTASLQIGISASVTFGTVACSAGSTVMVAFAANGPDSGEDLYIDVFTYDGTVTSNQTKLVDGFSNTPLDFNDTNAVDPTTVSPNPYAIALGSATQVYIRIYTVGTDAAAYYYIDDIELIGSGAGNYMPGYEGRPVSGTSVSVTGLSDSVTYYWRVKATNDSCESDWSVVTQVTTVISQDSMGPTFTGFGVTNAAGTVVLDHDFSGFPIFVTIMDSTTGVRWTSADYPKFAVTNPSGTGIVGPSNFVITGHADRETTSYATGMVPNIASSFVPGTWAVSVWAEDMNNYAGTNYFSFTAEDDDTTPPVVQYFTLTSGEGVSTVSVANLLSGSGWWVTGRVNDAGSGVDTNTFPPYFLLYDFDGTLRYSNSMICGFVDGGATVGGPITNSALGALGAASAGVWTAKVFVTDNDADGWTGDHLTVTGECAFTVIVTCPIAPASLYANPTNMNDFTANWSAASDAAGYVMDVSTSMTFGAAGGLIISEVMDGNAVGGVPKFIEIYNAGGSSEDLTGMKIRMGVNGAALADTFTFGAVSLAAGDAYVIAYNEADMTAAGFSAPDATDGDITGNGNDVYALTESDNTVIDVFGTVGVSADWYADSYAVRSASVITGNTTYTSGEWTITALSSGQPAGGTPGTPGSHTVSGGGTGASFVPGYSNLSVVATSQSVTGLLPSTVYYFRVASTSDGCISDYIVANVTTRPPANPSVATATADGNTLIDLAWTKNASYDVMIVYKSGSASTAPSDGTTYNVGDACGGGTVIYKGSGATLEHVVPSDVAHHYAFYSYSGSYYSTGLTDSDTTGAFDTGEIVETFSYTNNTTLAYGSGSNLWSGAWSGNTADFTNNAGSFTTQSNYPANAGNKVRVTPASAAKNVTRTGPYTFKTNVYATYIMNFEFGGHSGGSEKWSGAYLMEGGTPRVFFGESGGGDQVLGVHNTTSAKAMTAGTGNDYIVLVKYDIANDDAYASVYKIGTDTFPMYEPTSWDVTNLNVNGGTGFWIDGIRLEAGGNGGVTPGNTYFDEVRMAGTWSEIAIVPWSRVIYDGFGGTDPNSLSGWSGGTGWSDTWALGGDPFVNFNTGSMGTGYSSYYTPTGEKIVLYGNVDGRYVTATRTFNETFTAGPVYFSWIQNYQFNGSGKWAGLKILDSGTEKAFIGKVSAADKALGIDSSTDNRTSAVNLEHGAGNDYVVVAKYDFSTRELSATSYKLTSDVNCEMVAEEPNGYWQVVTTQSVGHITSLTGVRLDIGGTALVQVGDVYMDEVRVGTNWFEVTRRDGETQAVVMAAGPIPTLVYVGTNSFANVKDTLSGTVADITVTDEQLANESKPLSIAARWTDSNGVFITNANATLNIGSRAGRVNPNWDPAVLQGSSLAAIGYDEPFTNFYGYNGALSITSYVDFAFNVTNDFSTATSVYYMTMSAEDQNLGGGTITAPNGADAVPVWRALTINSNVLFYVADDDTVAPTIAGLVVESVDGVGTVHVDNVTAGGFNWSITGLVSDADSGINVNGSVVTMPDISPFVVFYDPTGAPRLTNVFNLSFTDGGATTPSSISNSSLAAVSSPPQGVWSAVVVVADNDFDRTGDAKYYTNACTFVVVDCPEIPTNLYVNPTNWFDFTLHWDSVAAADGYLVDVSTMPDAFDTISMVDDFTDDDYDASPVWAGDTADFLDLTNATLPNGSASTDGHFLGSKESGNNGSLYTASTETNEWRFSWGTPDYDPSSANTFYVILMSDSTFSGDAPGKNWLGYYLRIGVDGATDYIELWRKTGAGTVKVGNFSTGNYGTGALRNGLNIRVTRSSAGEFELFYSTGFTYPSNPTTSAGTLTDNNYGSSAYFGVSYSFASPSVDRRIYFDNFGVGDSSGYVDAYQGRPVSGTSVSVTGLTELTTYYYRIIATNDFCSSTYSVTGTVTTIAQPIPPMMTNFGINALSDVAATDGELAAGFNVLAQITDTNGGIDWVTAPYYVLSNAAGTQVASGDFDQGAYTQGVLSVTATGTVAAGAVSFAEMDLGTWGALLWAQDTNLSFAVTNYTFTVTDDDTTGPTVSDFFVGGAVVESGAGTCSVSTLSAGDIFVTGFNADGTDDFSFVTFTDIDPGVVIYFTDMGWSNDTWSGSGEGAITYTTPAAGLGAGDRIAIWGTTAAGVTASTGSVSRSGAFDFAAAGDQILVYQTAAGSTTFVFALSTDSTTWSNSPAAANNNSGVPPGLTPGVDAMHANQDLGKLADIDCGLYTGIVSGTEADLKAALFAGANWTSTDTGPLTQLTTPFTITDFCPGTSGIVWTNTDGAIFAGGYGVTVTVQDAVSGILVSNSVASYYLLYNDNSVLASSNYFVTPFANGTTSAQTLTTTGGPAISSSVVTLGTYTGVVVAADADNDRAGDTAQTISSAISFVVIDDDTDGPTASGFQIEGSGNLWDSMTGNLVLTGVVSDASGVDTGTMYYLMVSNDVGQGVVWSNNFTATLISGTNWAVSSDSTGPTIDGCGGEFIIRLVAVDGDLDRGTIDTTSVTSDVFTVTVIGSSTNASDYSKATNLVIDGTQLITDASLTMTDADINTGGYDLSMVLAHNDGIYTNSGSPSFVISNSIATAISQPFSNITIVAGSPDYYYATNYSLPGVPVANVATGWYSVYWTASNQGYCVASLQNRPDVGGTNVFFVEDDDNVTPVITGMSVAGQPNTMSTVTVAQADAGFSVTGLIQDVTSGIDITFNPPWFDIYDESGTLIFADQPFTTQPTHGGALVSAEPLAVTITNLAGAACENIYTVKVTVVDNDGDRTGDGLSTQRVFAIQIAGDGVLPVATNLAINSTDVTGPGITVYDGTFASGTWTMSMVVADSTLITTGGDAPSFVVRDPTAADVYTDYWDYVDLIGDSVFASNASMPTAASFSLGTFTVYWSGKTAGICYGQAVNTSLFGTGFTNVFTVADDDSVYPTVVDNFSVAGGTVTGGVGYLGCDDTRTNLVAGDIAIIGMNTWTKTTPVDVNYDSFAFVATVGIPAGTVINFTDNGWICGSLYPNEGTVTWTSTNCVAPGTVIIYKKRSDPSNSLSSATVNIGTIVDDSMFLINRQTEQILAFQGSESNPTFLYALNSAAPTAGVWQTCPIASPNSGSTALPPGLQNGLTAVSVNNFDDVVLSTNVLAIDGNREAVLEYIGNYSNWIGHDTIVFPLDTWDFTFPSLGSVGGTVTDGDILNGTWDITGQVFDADSGLAATSVWYIAYNSNNVAFIEAGYFTNEWATPLTEMQNLNISSVEPANSYTNVTIGTNVVWIVARDIDGDRDADSLTTYLDVPFTVVDDDINPPFFDYITWNGGVSLDTNAAASLVAVTARVSDVESGVAFASAPPYILVLDEFGAVAASNVFGVGAAVDGDSGIVVTSMLDVAALGCGTYTAYVVIVDADMDRLGDRLTATNSVTLDMAGNSAFVSNNYITAAGVQLESITTNVTDGMINTGGWEMAVLLTHPSSPILLTTPDDPQYQVLSAASNYLWSGSWTNGTGTTTYYATNVVEELDASAFNLIDTGTYQVIWSAVSDNACDPGIIGTNLMPVVDDDTAAPPWADPAITVTYNGAWTNVNDFTASWAASSDDSGFTFMRVINTDPADSLTMGAALGTNNTLHITDAAEGQTTNWIYAVDYDQDRPVDQLKTINTNFVIRLDMTPPETIWDLSASLGADASSEINLSWSALSGGGGQDAYGQPLSPWETYRVYYEIGADPTTNSPYYDLVEYPGLASAATDAVILSNLAFGAEYHLHIAGVDEAGNVGEVVIPAQVTLLAFNMTQAVTRVNSTSLVNAAHLSWTATNNIGIIPRAVDLIYVDSASFQDSLSNQWQLATTITNNSWAMEDDLNIAAGKTRFYRAAIGSSWMTNRSPRAASLEVWALRPVTVYPGQNWVSLPGRPLYNTVLDLIGTNLPAGAAATSPDATKISWYARVAGTTTNWWVSTQQVALVSDAGDRYWSKTLGGTTNIGNNIPMPLHEAFVIEIPTNSTAQTLYLIGQVPTNTLWQPITGQKGRNLVSLNLPRAMHPGQLDLAGKFVGGLAPPFSDQLWKYDRANQRAPYAVWLSTNPSYPGWRMSNSGYPACPTNYFSADDGIFFYGQKLPGDVSIQPPLPYSPPTQRMNP